MTRVVVTGSTPTALRRWCATNSCSTGPGGFLFDVWGYDDGPESIPSGIGQGADFGTHFPPPNGLRVYSAKMEPGGARAAGPGPADQPADLAESMRREISAPTGPPDSTYRTLSTLPSSSPARWPRARGRRCHDAAAGRHCHPERYEPCLASEPDAGLRDRVGLVGAEPTELRPGEGRTGDDTRRPPIRLED